ncbi:MAG: aldo/keto reductase [Anaerolineae bacterium]|nr:aldo/keto reductase [Anaerolineae bacterium]
MRTVPLGNTGEHVSALCLGTMYLGTRQDEDTSFRLLDQYVQAGGTFLDTANIYAHWIPEGRGGESEALVGRWMKARGNRDKLFIASKVGFGYQDVPVGLTPDLIEAECDKSLQRLGVDTIDLFYAHVDDRNTPIRETLAAFDRLVKAGKVRFIGASNYLAWRLERAHAASKADGLVEFCCLQQRHTYLRPKHGASFGAQRAVNDDMLDYARSRGGEFTMLAYSVLLGGAYTRADRPLPDQYAGPDSDARLAALRTVAEEVRATPNQVVLAWMMQNDPPVLPLIAASTPQQLDENLDALAVQLSAEQVRRLNAAGA